MSLISSLIIIFAINPTHVKIDRVDLVELNHFYGKDGEKILDQLIFYDWCGSVLHVVDWRIIRKNSPKPYKKGCDYYVIWHDTHNKKTIFRKIIAKDFRETWTTFDPEVTNRRYIPMQLRRKLK